MLSGADTFSDAHPTLNLTLNTSANVSILSTGTSYSLTLSSGNWSGTDTPNVAGNGLPTLVITNAGLSAFSTGISITDASGAGDSITFADSQSSAYFNNFSIALANASASALSFNGPTTFAGSAALTAAVNGSINVNAGTAFNDSAPVTINMGTGGLSLASTGSNTALVDSGNIVSQGGAITLDATGAVTISSDMTINATSGPITLAADVTSSGAGDDGVGTLSIASGATVQSTGAVTLRGADVNMDTSSNPAVVGAARALGTTASATLTGLNEPEALAFDSSGNLYVANGNGTTVSKFAPGATTASATLTGLSGPQALTFDSSGNLFVANYSGNTVSMFAPGATTASATLTGLNEPYALAVDAAGNLYVANVGNGTVSKFAPGASTASATFTGLSGPYALTFDSSGNLYVANDGSNTVSKFAPGATRASATLTGLSGPYALTYDSSGNLFVANFNNGTVSKFASGATTASATLTGLSGPDGLAFDTSGNLYVANEFNSTVSNFAPGATTASATFAGVLFPVALAFDSSGNLYVANAAGSTVSKFAPASTTAVASSVTIQSSVESRPMLIGGANGSPVAGINLTSAELGQIFTTSAGLVTIGDAQQAGDITLSAATPVTTSGATLNVTESSSSSAAIVLGTTGGTNLENLNGAVNLSPGTGGVQTTLLNATDVPLVAAGVTIASQPLTVNLGFTPGIGQQLTIIDDTAAPPASSPISGTFSNAAQGGILTTVYNGHTYSLAADYQGGDGNNLVLTRTVVPTQIVVTTEPPASVTARSPFGVTFTLEDADGNVATNYSGNVVVALSNNPGGSTLGGTTTVAVASGLAEFTDLTLNKPASGYTLDATAGTLTSADTSAISVAPGAATQLLITTEPPASVTADAPFGVTFTLEDADGNVATNYSGNVVVALSTNPGGSTLGGTTTVAVASGLAVFSDLTLNKAASGYTLDATAGTLTSADTSAISVAPGAATQLLITTEPPASVTADSPFGVTFTLEDADGNVATNYSGNVVVALSNNPGGSTLGGTTTVAVSSGVAMFNDLSLNRAASGYTLDATAGMLTSANTSPIAVMPGQLTITGAAGDSVIVRFLDAGDFSVTIVNGGNTTSNTYSLSEFDKFTYNGPNSYSKIQLIDSFHSYTATQSLASTDAVTSGFEFVGNGIANLYVYAAGTATVNVTNGPDHYYVDDPADGYSYVADPTQGVYSELSGFGAQTVTGSEGATYAYVYSTSHASIMLDPSGSSATVNSITTTLGNFPRVYAVGASDGSDQVTLHTEGGSFVGTPGFSYVSGTLGGNSFLVGALYCANVTAQATNPTDSAFFYSYPGNTFSGTVGTSSLTGDASAFGSFSTFTVDATGFNGVTVLESGSDTDVANLTSPGSGTFVETSTVSTLTVGSSTISVDTFFVDENQNVVPVAAKINVTGKHDGTDTAYLYDSAGTNALVVGGSSATLTNSLLAVGVTDFGSVTAEQRNGSDDTDHKTAAIDFALQLVGNWTTV